MEANLARGAFPLNNIIRPLFFLLFFILGIQFGLAQFMYFPYYRKNKVIYEKFNWNHCQTDHFDIYYYIGDVKILKDIAQIGESAYQRISQQIKHQLSATVPLIYYKTSTDFEQTNLFQATEGVLGAAEPVLYRVIIQGDMALDEIQDLVEHEFTRIFEYDLLWGSPGGALYSVNQPPDWMMEGFAEYNTQTLLSRSSLIVRDAVLNDRIPEFTESGQLYSRYPLPRDPAYDFGHAIFDFIEHKYGKNGIMEFWRSLKNTPLLGKMNPTKKVLSQTPKEFNLEFRFPLINSASTLIGQIGPVRGVLIFDIARAKLNGYPAKFYFYTGTDESGSQIIREADAIGSYGYGFEFFLLGLPLHLEFVKRLEWPIYQGPSILIHPEISRRNSG